MSDWRTPRVKPGDTVVANPGTSTTAPFAGLYTEDACLVRLVPDNTLAVVVAVVRNVRARGRFSAHDEQVAFLCSAVGTGWDVVGSMGWELVSP